MVSGEGPHTKLLNEEQRLNQLSEGECFFQAFLKLFLELKVNKHGRHREMPKIRCDCLVFWGPCLLLTVM